MGTWKVNEMHGPYGWCTHQAPGHLSCWEGNKTHVQPSLHLCSVPQNLNLSNLDLGSAGNAGPILDSTLQSNLQPEQCRPRKHTPPWASENPVWSIHYEHSLPHTCLPYLFAVFLPPHDTTEQASLNKWPPLQLYVRVEIRHWRDLQTEKAKINKEEGTALGVRVTAD